MNTKVTATQIPLNTCACTCGEPVGPKATYRPGHDARHAGMVARAVVENPKQAKALLATLPSDALRAKAQRAVARATAPKPEPKAKTEEQAA
ncbi:hypothetical protein WDU99_08315 [Microbacterium sp. Mu-80]|uniref:Uncharacterized protein n=1 Tax=Microbacterium bandirmense TaxID=3122050 RepID=A0ABU8LAI4_9MICO